MKDKIEKLVNDSNVKKEDKDVFKKTLAKVMNADKEINNELKNNQDNICIAFKEDPLLCVNETARPAIKSHIVPDNELEKMINKYGEIYNVNNMIHSVIKNEDVLNKSIANRDSTCFKGFCSECDKNFSNDINIDNPDNITKQHMYKYLFRYLGREISATMLYVKKIKDLHNKNEDGMNKLILHSYGVNFNEHIEKKIELLKYLKMEMIEMDILLKKRHNPKLHPAYIFGMIKCNENYGLIGQSLIFSKLITDIEIPLPFFLLFKEVDDKTYIYYFHINKVGINWLSRLNNTNEKFNFLSILAYYNSTHLYFNEDFANNKIKNIKDYIKENKIYDFEDLIKYVKKIK